MFPFPPGVPGLLLIAYTVPPAPARPARACQTRRAVLGPACHKTLGRPRLGAAPSRANAPQPAASSARAEPCRPPSRPLRPVRPPATVDSSAQGPTASPLPPLPLRRRPGADIAPPRCRLPAAAAVAGLPSRLAVRHHRPDRLGARRRLPRGGRGRPRGRAAPSGRAGGQGGSVDGGGARLPPRRLRCGRNRPRHPAFESALRRRGRAGTPLPPSPPTSPTPPPRAVLCFPPIPQFMALNLRSLTRRPPLPPPVPPAPIVSQPTPAVAFPSSTIHSPSGSAPRPHPEPTPPPSRAAPPGARRAWWAWPPWTAASSPSSTGPSASPPSPPSRGLRSFPDGFPGAAFSPRPAGRRCGARRGRCEFARADRPRIWVRRRPGSASDSESGVCQSHPSPLEPADLGLRAC